MRTTRRRARLRSAQYGVQRWAPPPAAIVLIAGVLAGLLFGVGGRLFGQADTLQQHYMLLVSDLYAQGVPLSAVRDRLISLGYSNPAAAVLAVADELARARDDVSKQEAEQLHQFAEALVNAPETASTVPTSVASTATGVPSPTATVVPAAVPPTSTPTAVPTVTPTSVPVVTTPIVPDVVPTLTPTAPPSPSPTGPPRPRATPAPEKAGVVKTSGGQAAVLRSGPTTKSTAVATIPNGAKVSVYGFAYGEALEPGESRWYHVVYNGHQGYLYVKLVQVGG
ncbi:MAG TPA: SH3 domain-containing protein [Chloroflexota bacterium]|nr:SH3 domain-containing protein [Chloroflexota bacterium]